MGATSIESKQFSNISATTAAFPLKGGKYALIASATFGGGNLQLQVLAMDGTTYVNAAASITAAGLTTYDLPQGMYRVSVTTATAVYVSLTSIPT